jgi:cell division protein FtsB
MRARLGPPIILLLLLAVLQWQLWNGRGSVRDVAQLRTKLADLKDGLEMVEERARAELGMVKPNEVFVQIAH